MPALPGAARFDAISRKWLAFAERRLAYFAELYRSGRWQRYYTPENFADRVVDVMKAVTVWRELAGKAPVSTAENNDRRPAA